MPQRMPLVALVVMFLAGCTHELPLALDANSSVQVVELGGPQYVLEPATVAYRALDHWVTSNRSGWSLYYATLPGRGIIVRSGTLDLQFLDTTVFAQTPEGPFQKNVTLSEYAFLRRSANGP